MVERDNLNHFSACIYKEGIGIQKEKLEKIRGIFLDNKEIINKNEEEDEKDVFYKQNYSFEDEVKNDNINLNILNRNPSLFNINQSIIQHNEEYEEKYDDFESSFHSDLDNNNFINKSKEEDSNIQEKNKINSLQNNYLYNNTSTTNSSNHTRNITNKNLTTITKLSSNNISPIKEENESDSQIFITQQKNSKNLSRKKDEIKHNKLSIDTDNNNYKNEEFSNINKYAEDIIKKVQKIDLGNENIEKAEDKIDNNKNNCIFED